MVTHILLLTTIITNRLKVFFCNTFHYIPLRGESYHFIAKKEKSSNKLLTHKMWRQFNILMGDNNLKLVRFAFVFELIRNHAKAQTSLRHISRQTEEIEMLNHCYYPTWFSLLIIDAEFGAILFQRNMNPKYYFFNDAVTQFFFVFAHNTSVVGYTHIARNRVSGLYRGAYSIQHQLCLHEIKTVILVNCIGLLLM